MRKLKTLLILMFATCLSLTLFACGGKKKKEDGATLYRVYDDEYTINDSVDKDKWAELMQEFELDGVTEEDEDVVIKGSDCEITGDIDFGTPDRYITTFTPKENNANSVAATVTVVIEHTWGSANADGVYECTKDHATMTPKDEDVAIHYGDFHYGTGIGELGMPSKKDAALEKIYLTEEQAQALNSNLHAETHGGLFNIDAGITGKDSSGRITDFGVDGVNGKTVPTVTAGDLTPGMSITIEGYAKTDAGNIFQESSGPWDTPNNNYNAPSYGIADPYSTLDDSYGAAVIVRSEGWVLYNGIGNKDSNNTLGALPRFVEGSLATGSGSTDAANYGSHPSDDGKNWPANFDPNNRPAFTSSDWKDWWVYSEGKNRGSLESYGGQDEYSTYVPVRVTWTYHTYSLNKEDENSEKVHIIEILSEYPSAGTYLRSFIKVEKPSRGSYRTIIHGDYSSLIITSSTYIETETVTAMRISDQPQSQGAATEYLAGQKLDTASLFKMEIQSVQTPAWHEGVAVASDMVYYYNATDKTHDQIGETELEDASKWTQLNDKALTTDMKIFKVVYKGYHALVPAGLVTVKANNVADAVGAGYDGTLNSRDPMISSLPQIAKEKSGEQTKYYADLTIAKAIFREIDTTEKSFFESTIGDATGYRYTTLIIRGLADFSISEQQKKTGTVKSGAENAEETYYYTYKADTDTKNVLLTIAIKESMLGHALTIEGLQTDTPVRLNFGTGSLGFEVTSTISYTGGNPKLNAGGEVKVVYKGIDADEAFTITAYSNDSSLGMLRKRGTTSIEGQQLGSSGISVTKYEHEGETATITYSFPAFNFESWTAMPFIRMTVGTTIVTEDYVEYDLSFTGTTNKDTKDYQSEGGAYFYTAGGKLYVVTVGATPATGKDVDISTIEKGGVTVNINTGDETTAKACDLSYAYDGKSAIAFADAAYSADAAYGIRTLLLDKAYGDYGLIVIASVDPAALGFTGDFGFQIGGVEQSEEAHYWKYNATDKTIAYTKIEGALTKTVVTPGDCFNAGIVASKVTEGGKTVFLAEYKEVGGEHVSDGHGHCKLCGGTLETKKVGVWTQTTMYNMKDGQVLDMLVTYPDSNDIKEAGGGTYGFVWTALANGDRYWTLTDGQMQKIPGNSEWGNRKIPYDETERPDGEKDMWTSLPADVLNGQPRLDNGQPIDTTSASAFKEFLANATVRYTATLKDGTLTMVTQYFKDGVLAYKWSQKITITSGNVQVGLTIDPNTNTWDTSKSQFVLANIDKSVITGNIDTTDTAKPSGHDDYTPSDGIAGEVDGSTITLSGSATKLGSSTADPTHYVAFKINFSLALDNTTTAVVKNGENEVTGSYAVLMNDNKTLAVYIPLKSGTAYTTFTIDLTNFAAATLQEDITIDLSNVAVSEVTATPNGANSLNLGEGTFTIEYTNIDGANTLVVNDGEPVALSAIGTSEATALKDGLSVKRSEITGKAVTLTFTKAAADLSKEIPGYTINLKNGDSVLANTQIAAPIAIGEFGTEVNSGSRWYAKAEGTTLYLFTDTKKDPGSLPLNVNAGHVTAVEALRQSDLGYTYAEGKFTFRSAKEFSPLVAHTTGIYTAAGSAFLAVLKIDLTSLNIEESTAYGFAIETEGAKYCTVEATSRDITPVSSDVTTEVTLRAPTCTTEGVTAKGNGTNTNGSDSTYFGHIVRAKADHDWTGAVSDKKGYDEAQECNNCHAIKYSQNSDSEAITQSWGKSLGGGKYEGWGSFGWQEIGVIHKGGYYTISGTEASSEAHEWCMEEPGITSVSGTNASGFRIDHWVEKGENTVFGFVSGQPEQNTGITYSLYDNKTNQVSSFNATAVKAALDGAKVTFTYDYTDSNKLLILTRFVSADDTIDFTVTWTITNEKVLACDTLYITLHPDEDLYTASSVETVVPQGKEVSPALSKHVHNWESSDKCECGAIYPGHGTEQGHDHIPGEEDSAHCSICGAVLEHQHTYNANYVCTECGNVDLEAIKAIAVVDQSVEKGVFGDEGTWHHTASGDLQTSAADFLVKFTFSQGTSAGITGCLEVIYTTPGSHGDGYLTYNPNDTTYWGGMISGDGAATVTSNIFGTKPTVLTAVTYEIYVWRLGTTMVVSYNVLNSNEVAWQQVLVLSNVEEQALKIHINGYTTGYTDLHGYLGSITAKVTD